jgi:hypothetical protein
VLSDPQQCAVIDLESADLIVALMDCEHRPLILERFSGWEDRVEYWQVGDVSRAQPDVALGSIETEIAALIERAIADHARRRSDRVKRPMPKRLTTRIQRHAERKRLLPRCAERPFEGFRDFCCWCLLTSR